MTGTVPNPTVAVVREVCDLLDRKVGGSDAEEGHAVETAVARLRGLADVLEANPWTGTADLDPADLPAPPFMAPIGRGMEPAGESPPGVDLCDPDDHGVIRSLP